MISYCYCILIVLFLAIFGILLDLADYILNHRKLMIICQIPLFVVKNCCFYFFLDAEFTIYSFRRLFISLLILVRTDCLNNPDHYFFHQNYV